MRRSPTFGVMITMAGALAGALACAAGDAPANDSTAAPAVATSDSAPRTPASDSAPRDTASGGVPRALGPAGGGALRVGMTQAQLRTALGMPAASPATEQCVYLEGAGRPAGLYFMLIRDTLVRIDVRDSSVTTEEGARLGDTEARVNQLYGARVVTSPHKYTGPQGHYMTVTPADARYRIVFETDGAKVLNWRVGRIEEVEWVEGCS